MDEGGNGLGFGEGVPIPDIVEISVRNVNTAFRLLFFLSVVPPPLFFWGGELGPHLTQCRLGRGLPPYQVAS